METPTKELILRCLSREGIIPGTPNRHKKLDAMTRARQVVASQLNALEIKTLAEGIIKAYNLIPREVSWPTSNHSAYEDLYL